MQCADLGASVQGRGPSQRGSGCVHWGTRSHTATRSWRLRPQIRGKNTDERQRKRTLKAWKMDIASRVFHAEMLTRPKHSPPPDSSSACGISVSSSLWLSSLDLGGFIDLVPLYLRSLLSAHLLHCESSLQWLRNSAERPVLGKRRPRGVQASCAARSERAQGENSCIISLLLSSQG